jgi:MtN3 and saliva related transmembrane protein
MIGFHHMRARARTAKGLEPFPATNIWKRFLDYLMNGVGLLAPLALVPQILQIYTTRSAAGISLLTWLLLAIINILWAIYGAVHKDRQLFFANALIVLFDLVIVIGILLY